MSQIPSFSVLHKQLVSSLSSFNEVALQVFQYQAKNNLVYKNFIHYLGIQAETVREVTEIPFLPIGTFKTQSVTCFEPVWSERIYLSSGTTGLEQSKHYVRHYSDYLLSFSDAFEHFYGSANDYCILALLPAYLERDGSSLVEMANELIKVSQHPKSGFYLNNYEALITTLNEQNALGQQCLLLGVTFALLDLAEMGPFNWNNTIVMETGGMKGRRKELTRIELHNNLTKAFGVKEIHSEYGMTELLSQAYSSGQGIFRCPPWMKVFGRDTHDPLSPAAPGATSGLNVIDLANLHSCSFIATQDLGKVYADGSFEVLGRFDQSDLRGCNLMVV